MDRFAPAPKLDPSNTTLGEEPVTTRRARTIFSVIVASLLGACGGGGDESTAAACAAGVGGINPAFCAPNPNAVTVAGTQATAPLVLAPAALTIGNCTTRVPFIFTGGVGPYTIFTSDNFNVPVSTALPLGDGRHYFFADVKYSVTGEFSALRDTTAFLTVLDSQAKSAVASVLTPLGLFNPCPTNPLLKISPETANFRMSEILAFQITGGPSTPATTVTFADPDVAKVLALGTSTFTVQAQGVAKSTLMTVAATDGQRSSVVINVLPQP